MTWAGDPRRVPCSRSTPVVGLALLLLLAISGPMLVVAAPQDAMPSGSLVIPAAGPQAGLAPAMPGIAPGPGGPRGPGLPPGPGGASGGDFERLIQRPDAPDVPVIWLSRMMRAELTGNTTLADRCRAEVLRHTDSAEAAYLIRVGLKIEQLRQSHGVAFELPEDPLNPGFAELMTRQYASAVAHHGPIYLHEDTLLVQGLLVGRFGPSEALWTSCKAAAATHKIGADVRPIVAILLDEDTSLEETLIALRPHFEHLAARRAALGIVRHLRPSLAGDPVLAQVGAEAYLHHNLPAMADDLLQDAAEGLAAEDRVRVRLVSESSPDDGLSLDWPGLNPLAGESETDEADRDSDAPKLPADVANAPAAAVKPDQRPLPPLAAMMAYTALAVGDYDRAENELTALLSDDVDAAWRSWAERFHTLLAARETHLATHERWLNRALASLRDDSTDRLQADVTVHGFGRHPLIVRVDLDDRTGEVMVDLSQNGQPWLVLDATIGSVRYLLRGDTVVTRVTPSVLPTASVTIVPMPDGGYNMTANWGMYSETPGHGGALRTSLNNPLLTDPVQFRRLIAYHLRKGMLPSPVVEPKASQDANPDENPAERDGSVDLVWACPEWDRPAWTEVTVTLSPEGRLEAVECPQFSIDRIVYGSGDEVPMRPVVFPDRPEQTVSLEDPESFAALLGRWLALPGRLAKAFQSESAPVR